MARHKVVAALLAILALPEVVYFAAALLCPKLPPPGGCAVLTLGYPTNKDGTPSAVQRWRVATAIGIMRAQDCGFIVMAGGNPHSPFVEAETMAQLAMSAGVPGTRVLIEGSSRDTWENIQFSLPFVLTEPKVLIVSDPLHVHRAKRYWCRQRPDLCERAYPATRYAPLRLYGMKWLGMLGETAIALRDEFKTAPMGPPASRP